MFRFSKILLGVIGAGLLAGQALATGPNLHTDNSTDYYSTVAIGGAKVCAGKAGHWTVKGHPDDSKGSAVDFLCGYKYPCQAILYLSSDKEAGTHCGASAKVEGVLMKLDQKGNVTINGEKIQIVEVPGTDPKATVKLDGSTASIFNITNNN